MTGRRSLLGALLLLLLVSCRQGPADAPAGIATIEPGGPIVPLSLELQNSGLPGGYLWMAISDDRASGRWHRFAMAELLCVTCPVPLARPAASYDIAIVDDACTVRSARRTAGGVLRWEIGVGPRFTLGPAPTGGDWIPGDSAPADPGAVPCAPP